MWSGHPRLAQTATVLNKSIADERARRARAEKKRKASDQTRIRKLIQKVEIHGNRATLGCSGLYSPDDVRTATPPALPRADRRVLYAPPVHYLRIACKLVSRADIVLGEDTFAQWKADLDFRSSREIVVATAALGSTRAAAAALSVQHKPRLHPIPSRFVHTHVSNGLSGRDAGLGVSAELSASLQRNLSNPANPLPQVPAALMLSSYSRSWQEPSAGVFNVNSILAPDVNGAATQIQRNWLSRYNSKVVACSRVQSLYRMWATRQQFRQIRLISLSAITRLQAWMRMLRAKVTVQKLRHAKWLGSITKIQAAWRGWVGRQDARRRRAVRSMLAATRIQAIIRGHSSRVYTVHMQAQLQMQAFDNLVRSVLLLQRVWRGVRSRMVISMRRSRWAAVRLQAWIRMLQLRLGLHTQAALRLECWWRVQLALGVRSRIHSEWEAAELERMEQELAYIEDAVSEEVHQTREWIKSTDAGKAAVKREKERVKLKRGQLKKIRHSLTPAAQKQLEITELFNIYDIDASGGLDQDELGLLLEDLCEALNATQLEEIMEQIDADGSGVIELNEFMQWYLSEAGDDSSTTTGMALFAQVPGNDLEQPSQTSVLTTTTAHSDTSHGDGPGNRVGIGAASRLMRWKAASGSAGSGIQSQSAESLTAPAASPVGVGVATASKLLRWRGQSSSSSSTPNAEVPKASLKRNEGQNASVAGNKSSLAGFGAAARIARHRQQLAARKLQEAAKPLEPSEVKQKLKGLLMAVKADTMFNSLEQHIDDMIAEGKGDLLVNEIEAAVEAEKEASEPTPPVKPALKRKWWSRLCGASPNQVMDDPEEIETADPPQPEEPISAPSMDNENELADDDDRRPRPNGLKAAAVAAGRFKFGVKQSDAPEKHRDRVKEKLEKAKLVGQRVALLRALKVVKETSVEELKQASLNAFEEQEQDLISVTSSIADQSKAPKRSRWGALSAMKSLGRRTAVSAPAEKADTAQSKWGSVAKARSFASQASSSVALQDESAVQAGSVDEAGSVAEVSSTDGLSWQAIMRLKLKAKKKFNDITGRTLNKIAASNVIRRACQIRRGIAQQQFRLEQPPRQQCERCKAAFAVYGTLSWHQMKLCPKRTGVSAVDERDIYDRALAAVGLE